jgi:hypothetical protein
MPMTSRLRTIPLKADRVRRLFYKTERRPATRMAGESERPAPPPGPAGTVGPVTGHGWHLAELNIGRLREPLTHPATKEFVDALDEINALAESSPGFVWRLTDEATGRSSSYVQTGGDPLEIVNLSTWETPEQLHDFVYRTAHTPYLRRRRAWFQRVELFLVCWWVPAGHRPSVDEAMARLAQLGREGPSDAAFTLRDVRPAPAVTAASPPA